MLIPSGMMMVCALNQIFAHFAVQIPEKNVESSLDGPKIFVRTRVKVSAESKKLIEFF
jgi:hypothetical protein